MKKEITIIKKELPQILLKDSKKHLPLVIDVQNPDVLATGISIIAKQSFRMAGTEMIEEDIVFKADHPFIYLIRDNYFGLILFMGRLVDPASET